MRVGIIGAGALGTLLAGCLGRVGEVWIFSTHAETLEALRRGGARVVVDSEEMSTAVQVAGDPTRVPLLDAALICVKAYETERAAEAARRMLGQGGLVTTLQNGLGHFEILADIVGSSRAVLGVTYLGASWLGPGRVRWAGRGPTYLATRLEIATQLEEMAGLLSHAGLEVHLVEDAQGLLWGKLAVNAAINPLAALLRVPNGALLESEAARRLLQAAALEAAQVAAAAGIRLPYEDPIAQVESVCRATAANYASMLQDVLHRRRTEIQAINGALVREAERWGVKVPLQSCFVQLVEALESSYRHQVEG